MSRALLSFPGTPVAAVFDLWQDDNVSSVQGATLTAWAKASSVSCPAAPLFKHKGNNELSYKWSAVPQVGHGWMGVRIQKG